MTGCGLCGKKTRIFPTRVRHERSHERATRTAPTRRQTTESLALFQPPVLLHLLLLLLSLLNLLLLQLESSHRTHRSPPLRGKRPRRRVFSSTKHQTQPVTLFPSAPFYFGGDCSPSLLFSPIFQSRRTHKRLDYLSRTDNQNCLRQSQSALFRSTHSPGASSSDRHALFIFATLGCSSRSNARKRSRKKHCVRFLRLQCDCNCCCLLPCLASSAATAATRRTTCPSRSRSLF